MSDTKVSEVNTAINQNVKVGQQTPEAQRSALDGGPAQGNGHVSPALPPGAGDGACGNQNGTGTPDTETPSTGSPIAQAPPTEETCHPQPSTCQFQPATLPTPPALPQPLAPETACEPSTCTLHPATAGSQPPPASIQQSNNPLILSVPACEPSTCTLQPATAGSQPPPASIQQSNNPLILSVPACEPSTCTLHPATSHSPAPSVPNPSIQQSINPSIHEAIARLAKLSRLDYDLARRAEAKRLQLRLATLDDAVDRARIVEDDAQADAYVLPQLKPWPEPILDAPALFDQVHERYLLYLYLPPGADVVLTLWPAHAAAVGAFCHTPRLNLTSSEPGCGKTTALDLTTALIPKVLRTDHMKPAVMFRVIHREGPARPAVLLDELDAYLRLYPELRGLINAGHSPGACVYRCEGGTVRSFQIFAATALAGLGTLTPTLRDRSIVIHLV
ncbi:MAG TPA: hypothetical protein VNZ64_03940, partial [Candidatus Acidoferrum sp.]|nr:hypothetical protein [Candidatus Acidoferrum sp.]